MTKIDLGSVGATIAPTEGHGFVDTAVELEALGYATVWLTGGPMTALSQIVQVVQATEQVRVATSVISVDRFPADDVAALYTDLEAGSPGRFVPGLGGAHGPKPLATLNGYLDRLDALGVPASTRVMAALGPRMLDLARERASGAVPVLVTPEFTADARGQLNDDVTLAICQLAVLEPDLERGRAIGRTRLGFLSTLPAYQANFRRMGFTDDEIAAKSDRLVDALVPSGDAEALAAHVDRQLQAGADHVALLLSSDGPDGVPPIEQWRQLAEVLTA